MNDENAIKLWKLLTMYEQDYREDAASAGYDITEESLAAIKEDIETTLDSDAILELRDLTL